MNTALQQPQPRRLRAVDTDPVTFALLQDWLAEEGWQVVDHDGAGPAQLLLVDVPYPRREAGAACLSRLMAEHPGAPILVISPTFLPSVTCSGECARTLGVAGVLPKPLSREPLLAAVRRLAAGDACC